MSKTGDAIEALYAALVAKSVELSPKIPTPLQNEELPARLIQASGNPDLSLYLNVWDGNPEAGQEMLGAESGAVSNGFEIVHPVIVEWAVAGGTRAERRAAFEAGLEAIDDAIAADRTLGGKVFWATIRQVLRPGGGLVTDGLPNILAAEITVVLDFNSSRPF